MKIFIGADHGGIELKNSIIAHLKDEGYEVMDMVNPNEGDLDDYPDTAYMVCKGVMEEKGNLGIVICKDGIGMSIAANKYKGIRCARIMNETDAMKSKNHSNSNCIALGSENGIPVEITLKMVDIFITTPEPTEERRIRRINKLMAIESGEYSEL